MTLKTGRLIIMIGLTICTFSAFADSAKPIRIGEINSYGSAPQFAVPYRQGWQLAVEEINATGGVNGRMIEVLSRDDEGKPDIAVVHAKTLIERDNVDVLCGTYLSNIGLAVSAVAAQNRKLFLAAEPLSDAITLDRGNRYTFRLRPSTYMQASMLVDAAARLPGRRWAMLAPNYEYGQSAVASFKMLLKARRPDVEFIGEQWPALGKMDAPAVVDALEKAKPDAIFNASFGPDFTKFVVEGQRRHLFDKTAVVSILGGEPENLDALRETVPKGWIVTGYPAASINTPDHDEFVASYRKKYNEGPRLGSIVGYSMIKAIAEAVRKANSTDSEKLVAAFRDLHFKSPVGPVTFRAIDQQSSMGTFVGVLESRDGKSTMGKWQYADGTKYMPDDSYVRTRRPASAMR